MEELGGEILRQTVLGPLTLGQILFYGGIGLLAATVVVGILFILIKPKYTPESPSYQGMGQGAVPPMYNGYPTDPLRRQTGQPGAPGRPPVAPSGQMQGMPPAGPGAAPQSPLPPQETWPLR